jgi:hypothetical protein
MAGPSVCWYSCHARVLADAWGYKDGDDLYRRRGDPVLKLA